MAGSYRMRDINNILEELKELDRLGIKHVIFIDDTLNMPKKRFSQLLDLMLAEGLTRFNCYSFCRCQFIDDDIAEKMAKCGFQSVLLGIESGSEKILQNMNKKAHPDEYLEGIKKPKKNNILTFSAIIFGFPGETEETIQKSIDFINNSGVDYVYIQPFFCLHNSPVYKDREKYGLSGEGAMWKHDTMSSSECNAMVKKAFTSITGATHTHMENTMWEYAYFKAIGFTNEDYKAYRAAINNLRETVVNPESHDPVSVAQQLEHLREMTTSILD